MQINRNLYGKPVYKVNSGISARASMTSFLNAPWLLLIFSVEDLLNKSNGFLNATGMRSALDLLHAHPEPADATLSA